MNAKGNPNANNMLTNNVMKNWNVLQWNHTRIPSLLRHNKNTKLGSNKHKKQESLLIQLMPELLIYSLFPI